MDDIPQGLWLWAVYRRSKKKQAISIDRQRDLVQSVVQVRQAKIVGELVLDDHSATAGQQWEALYSIINTRVGGNRFDGVIASDYSRIGRTMDEVERYYLNLCDAKLVLLTQKEGLLSGRDAWMKRLIASSANERYAEAQGVNISSASMTLIKSRIVPHTANAPFGLDRMTYDSRGVALYRLHKLAYSEVVKLSVDGERVLERYSGVTREYFPRRQKDERIKLLPGCPEALTLVRRIFTMSYEGVTPDVAARFLNEENIYSPNGKRWSSGSIKCILRNEVYTGVGVCNKHHGGVHAKRHKNGTRLFGTPRRPEIGPTGARRKFVKLLDTPIEDWFVVRCPETLNILPKNIRRFAKAANRRHRRGTLKKASNNQEGVGIGGFFLTGIPFRVSTKNRMWGITVPREKKRYRYYKDVTSSGPKIAIRAELLESVFLRLVSSLYGDRPSLIKAVSAKLVEKSRRSQGQGRLSLLVKELAQMEEHLAMLIELGPAKHKNAASKATELSAKIASHKAEIAELSGSSPIAVAHSPSAIADRFVSGIKNLSRGRSRQQLIVLRKLALCLIETIEISSDDSTLVFKLRIPSRLTHDPKGIAALFSTDRNNTHSVSLGTKCENDIFLGEFRVSIGRSGHGVVIRPFVDGIKLPTPLAPRNAISKARVRVARRLSPKVKGRKAASE